MISNKTIYWKRQAVGNISLFK